MRRFSTASTGNRLGRSRPGDHPTSALPAKLPGNGGCTDGQADSRRGSSDHPAGPRPGSTARDVWKPRGPVGVPGRQDRTWGNPRCGPRAGNPRGARLLGRQKWNTRLELANSTSTTSRSGTTASAVTANSAGSPQWSSKATASSPSHENPRNRDYVEAGTHQSLRTRRGGSLFRTIAK